MRGNALVMRASDRRFFFAFSSCHVGINGFPSTRRHGALEAVKALSPSKFLALSSLVGQGRGRRCPSYSESQNTMKQVWVSEAVVPGSRREFLTLRDLGIGIRF
jgi:hypothetical protein